MLHEIFLYNFQCSKDKCEGVQRRTLSCKKTFRSGAIQNLPDSDCPNEKPPTELTCNTGVHCYEWRPVYPNCSECRGNIDADFVALNTLN